MSFLRQPVSSTVALILALGLTGCGGDDVATVRVKLSTLAGALDSAPRGAVRADSWSDRLAAATDNTQTEFTFARVEGLKLTLKSLHASKADSAGVELFSSASGKEIELKVDGSGSVTLAENLEIPVGDYTGIRAVFAGSYGLKAFCKTDAKFIYTKGGGNVEVAKALTPAAEPSDYTYRTYPFTMVDIADSAAGPNPDVDTTTDFNFTIAQDSTPTLTLLFDLSYIATCKGSGVPAQGVGAVGALEPFRWAPKGGAIADYFPTAEAHFGMIRPATFLWVSNSASGAEPVSETYLSSSDAADLTAGLDYPIGGATPEIALTTFAFRPDGGILGTLSRKLTAAAKLEPFSSDHEKVGDSYSFSNGEWNDAAGRLIRDRKITGFKRTVIGGSATATISDGPECWAGSDPNNHSRQCLGGSSDYYFKRSDR